MSPSRRAENSKSGRAPHAENPSTDGATPRRDDIPLCRICGIEMEIQAVGPVEYVYACSAKGNAHYSESRIDFGRSEYAVFYALRQRIRIAEDERNHWKQACLDDGKALTERATKAEQRVAELEGPLMTAAKYHKEERIQLRTRIASLERALAPFAKLGDLIESVTKQNPAWGYKLLPEMTLSARFFTRMPGVHLKWRHFQAAMSSVGPNPMIGQDAKRISSNVGGT